VLEVGEAPTDPLPNCRSILIAKGDATNSPTSTRRGSAGSWTVPTWVQLAPSADS